MVRILISMETFKQEDSKRFPVYGSFASYIQKLSKYNLLPLFVCPGMTQEAIDEVYNLADGVHFMGGSDFDPTHYNQKKHRKTTVTEASRDQLEIALLRRTLQDKKPFLGICRGCQALAIASGGTLVQHVPDVVHHQRHSLKKSQSYEDLVSNTHIAIIEKTSRIYKLFKKDRIIATSGHHQAVATVGKNFKISGKSKDGIAEIIEHIDPKYFCFGVQAHPEVEEKGSLESLFSSFAEAAYSYSKRGNTLFSKHSYEYNRTFVHKNTYS